LSIPDILREVIQAGFRVEEIVEGSADTQSGEELR
jgi:hypothetical protein